ncbi:hypothetical protein JMJ77_0009524 [Colletotrichum scovillei]|uniref:Secreted protein n=1 Tax=Colletotrichum scovillei TaxID=1209932 RepID=A0A9P7R273_9PEZI|nr:hypothetical protein JMJ77_0009524 [Colletotrichum scovillei]KAG7052603.1 hypothetical protein JMJ78_0005619 [Colletotrichum scovillei]KAG7064894.1 hypothetical protein JMJ76_0012652 [Colletotrichum scovillei]
MHRKLGQPVITVLVSLCLSLPVECLEDVDIVGVVLASVDPLVELKEGSGDCGASDIPVSIRSGRLRQAGIRR